MGFSSSLCFMSSKAYPFIGLGSSLKPLMDLGLPSFSLLQAQVFYFYGVQFSVPFWALVQYCDFLDLNKKLPEYEEDCSNGHS